MGKRERKMLKYFLAFFAMLSFVAIIMRIIINNESINHEEAKFPEINIELSGVTLDDINNGDKNIRYFDNSLTVNDYNLEETIDGVEIKGRGNYSWMLDKKSYNIKLPYKISLLGLDKHKKWGLISNSIDDSFLRNDLGNLIAKYVSGKQTIDGRFAELKVDERDLGLYYLSELVSIDKRSVDLRDPSAVLIEFDKVYCKYEEIYKKTYTLGDCLTLKDVGDKNNNRMVLFDSFLFDYNRFENTLLSKNYSEVFNYIDKKSWAEYYLTSEFTGNVDAYVTSWFLYKDGLNDKIHVGPAWDFDAGFGNKNWGNWPDEYYGPNMIMARLNYSFGERKDYVEGQKMGCRYDIEGKDDSLEYVSPVMCYLVDIPEFINEVRRLYREQLMWRREEVLKYIRDRANYIRDAAIHDNEMWGKGDFDEAVDYLIWWVDKRFDLFDGLYGGRKIEYFNNPLEV